MNHLTGYNHTGEQINQTNKLTKTDENMMKRNEVYSYVTDRIVEQLAAGEVPWINTRAKPLIRATSFATGKEYRGTNFWLLNYRRVGASPFWVTFKQALELKGNVRKGERSSIVVFWKKYESKEIDIATGKGKMFPVLRYYSVFNLDQCDNLPCPLLEPVSIKDPIVAAQKILDELFGREVVQCLDSANVRAYYDTVRDRIVMPQGGAFTSPEQYYRTFFHELAHWTGHKSRLNRWGEATSSHTTLEGYGFEELVAELCAGYLCALSGIFEETSQKHASYCQAWIKEFQKDDKLFVRASAKAQKAADYILGFDQGASAIETELAA
jgi:antirestriction protein ArdC